MKLRTGGGLTDRKLMYLGGIDGLRERRESEVDTHQLLVADGVDQRERRDVRHLVMAPVLHPQPWLDLGPVERREGLFRFPQESSPDLTDVQSAAGVGHRLGEREANAHGDPAGRPTFR